MFLSVPVPIRERSLQDVLRFPDFTGNTDATFHPHPSPSPGQNPVCPWHLSDCVSLSVCRLKSSSLSVPSPVRVRVRVRSRGKLKSAYIRSSNCDRLVDTMHSCYICGLSGSGGGGHTWRRPTVRGTKIRLHLHDQYTASSSRQWKSPSVRSMVASASPLLEVRPLVQATTWASKYVEVRKIPQREHFLIARQSSSS